MKRSTVLSLIVFLSFAMSATWTVQREAVTVSASSDWKNIQPLATLYKGEGGTILDQYDDWVEVKVTESKVKENVGKTGYLWVPALKDGIIGAGEKGKQGAELHDRPGNDVAGNRVKVQVLGLLWPGDKVQVIGYTRPTWFLIEYYAQGKRKEAISGKGWVYAPYGIVK